MRIVLDSNVVASGSLWGGIPADVLNLWKSGKVHLFVSEDIVKEYVGVLKRLRYSDDGLEKFMCLINDLDHTVIISPVQRFKVITDDPTDDKFLDCAIEAQADAIISGNDHLLKLGNFRGIPILSSRKFLSQFKDQLAE
ncbi:MAG: putative toxin-antitoxin system toxin component, PIN family [Elusimicrobia bacterium]|nr:putative toxin-antitoxin system toxin component, PIN family [Elusimicrobiota bacterium]